MHTFNIILQEIKDIPADRLEEVYQLVHLLNPKTNKYNAEVLRKKNLSFAGAFSDMSKKDYADFLKYIRETRNQLFDRNNEL